MINDVSVRFLLNLLSNAIKFTEEGHVKLAVKADTENISFTISDTGPGIDEKGLEIIFEPFQQTETGIRHAGGTGLGLPITKRLVEAHGGTLTVDTAVGKGTEFIVQLPIHSQALLDIMHTPLEELQHA